MARSQRKRPTTDAATETKDDIWSWASSIYYMWQRTRFRLESGMTDYHRLSAVTSFDLEELESKRAPVLDYTRTVPGLKLDHRLFAELANLAEVSSAEGIERLRRGVLYELSHYWVAPPVAADSEKRALAQLRKLAKVSQDLSTIVSNLDEQALRVLAVTSLGLQSSSVMRSQGYFHTFTILKLPHEKDVRETIGPEPRGTLSDYRSQLKFIPEFAKLSSEALMRACKPKPQGRPRGGSFSIWRTKAKPLADFTLTLLLDVRAAGGRLTFNKNSRTGTLVEALALLRPYARPGVIPNELPSTLARLKTLDTKLATARWNIQS
jgi:hypothetical protein